MFANELILVKKDSHLYMERLIKHRNKQRIIKKKSEKKDISNIESIKQKAYQNSRGSKFVSELKSNATPAEIKAKTLIEDMGIKFSFQKMFFNCKTLYIMDFYIKSYDGSRYGIEIDGGYHTKKSQKEYDKRRDEWLLKKRKTTVLRFKNEELFNNPDKFCRIIQSLNPIII